MEHWRFNNEQWREFLNHEKLDTEHRNFLDLRSVLFVSGADLNLISLAAFAKGKLPAFTFAFIGGSLLIGVCYGVHRLFRYDTEQKLNTVISEVKITDQFVDLNRLFSIGANTGN